ncbi:MAG: ROK family transcriptional regulator [Clostridiales bacterium]|nr:ROK family transcriptional regulator [Clostridiales bacterium]
MNIRKLDQETLKNLNRQIILNYIRKYREISRIDLAEHTKLSPTTVSSITSELIQKGIVTETRIGESNGGRRPVMVGINPMSACIIAIILTPKGIRYALADLNCDIYGEKYVKCTIDSSDKAMDVILNSIQDIKGGFPDAAGKIYGITISIPGVIDHEEGKVLYSSRLNIKDFNMASEVKRKTGIDCYVFKDTDAFILGEHRFGVAIGYENFVYIIVENGVGMSYINSGKLFKPGPSGGFELGHMTIDSNGPECSCGNRGCLGTVVSEIPILNRIKKLKEKGYETCIVNTDKLSLSDIVDFSNKNDKAARYVLEEQARLLGIAVATVVNLLNPELVVIGGPLSKCRWGFLDILNDCVKDRALQIYSKNTTIKFARPGEESALKGMADEIYERDIFRPVEI